MVEETAIDSILKLLINSEDNLIANERHQILSLYNELRFLRAILKDMEEKHFEDDESENLAMQISCVAYDTEEIIRSFVANVARQRDSNKGNKIGFVFDFRLNLSDIMEQINPIEVKVIQFYDKMYKIQVLHDRNSSDGVPSMRNRTSMMNRNMEQEEIIVGFDDEVMSIKEQLAGWKMELDIISIVGMPGLEDKLLSVRKFASRNNPFDDVCSFIYQTFKLLRVLDLWSGNAYFTGKLAQLVNLRYLAIMLNGYCELPPSISNLSNLETLIIFTCSEVILPHNFWSIRLRHLYTKGARYSLPFLSEKAAMYDSCPSVLENLRTIANLKPYGPVQDLLARTPHLTKLGFRGPLISYSGCWMFPNLDSLRHLETLKLHNTFRIQSTNLQGVKFPANLKRLTLRYTGIEWKEISILGMLLPNLELLKLESDACWGPQWATTDQGFLRLKFLKLKNLKVERWITCSSHFPALQHLSLESCENLEEIPSSLGDVLTLEMIEVAFCHPSAEESAKKIKEEQESNGNNGLKVLIRNTSVTFESV
ncbi:hypothetical protein LOK49_Contig748G00002 [Camellia lanceoleosa]|nr:hypothetical protein LOK49_Contig748G00002 [Camellia lanceoleosa]